MTLQTFFTIILVVLFLFGIWSTNSKRGKVFCLYEGVDKTVERKWVKIDDKKVVFGGKKFDVLTQCVQSFWNRSGIHMLFPTKVNYLHFVWYSRYPLNPNDYRRTWDTPELRNMINLEEQMKSYFKNFTPSTAKKASALAQYLPLITIVLVVLVGFYVYSNQQSIAMQLNAMQNQINTIMPK